MISCALNVSEELGVWLEVFDGDRLAVFPVTEPQRAELVGLVTAVVHIGGERWRLSISRRGVVRLLDPNGSFASDLSGLLDRFGDGPTVQRSQHDQDAASFQRGRKMMPGCRGGERPTRPGGDGRESHSRKPGETGGTVQ